MILQGLILRGPWQSVPTWVEHLDAADAASRTAWAAYANVLLGPALYHLD